MKKVISVVMSLFVILFSSVLMSGCQSTSNGDMAASTTNNTSFATETGSLPAAVRHYDHMNYEMSMKTETYTSSDRVFTVAIRGTEPGYFSVGEYWRLSQKTADGSLTQLGECLRETAIELEPAEGEEYVDSTLSVTLEMLGITQPLTPGTYVLQYVEQFTKDGVIVTEPVYSLYFSVTE